MIPFRPALLDLDIAHRQAAGFDDGERVGLGVEDVDRLAAALGDVRPGATGAEASEAVPRRMPPATRR